ncbi:MAG: hypothetical protein Q7V57_13945 [Actinomycetota bacterium]|nr:hypothetical protein [Actinomycetota bacterium]
MSDDSSTAAGDEQQPAPAPFAPPAPPTPGTPTPPETTSTPLAPVAGGNRRLGVIIGALVAVAAVIVGIVVFAGGDDDKGSTPSPGDSTADSSVTTDAGGGSNNGGDPNDPCSSVRLSTELAADNLDAVTGTCDGTWAVAASGGEPLFIAHVANGSWVRLIDLTSTGVCHDDAVGFQWPATVIDAVTWPCTTFAPPQAGAYVAESDGSEPLAVGMQGERVAGLQNALMLRGLLAPEGIDGMFGGGTRQALLVFQAFGGVELTAQGDTTTLRTLGLLADERASLSPLVANGRALGDLLIGGNGRRVNEALTAILGPPDRVSVPSMRTGSVTCNDPEGRTYTWSGLTVEVAGYDPDTFADSDWKMVYWRYELDGPTLDISTPRGARLGETLEQWKTTYPDKPISSPDGEAGGFLVDLGLSVDYDATGIINAMYSGSPNCEGGE